MDFLHSATEALSNSFSPKAEDTAQAAQELRATLGDGLCVCVVGDGPAELSRAVAKRCSETLGAEAVFVTAGQDSAHGFADWCSSEVYHLIPTWDSTGFRGTDLAVGTDAQDCSLLLGSLGDIFLCFADGDAEALQRAQERGCALLPLGAGGAEGRARPWFVTEEQWRCLAEETPEKVASACAAALASFDAHHKAVCLPEQCDELCYVDADAERWAQLAEAHNVPDVAKGKLRLEGSFQGTATTHTHQMDLNIGVNMEMPSKVAAKTMKQLSESGLVPEEEEPKRRGVFGALADYFRKDAQDAYPDVSSMIMSSMQMKLDDVHAAYEVQQQELRSALEASQARAVSLAEKLKVLEETKPEGANGDAAGDGLKVQELEAALRSREEELQEQKLQAAKEALHEAQEKMQAWAKEKAELMAELNELKASHARACGELESLREMPSPTAHREAQAKLLEKQQECEALAQKLHVAEAVGRDAKRRMEDAEAASCALRGREAEAQARAVEASNQLDARADETERLGAELLELREALSASRAAERRLGASVAELSEKLAASVKRPEHHGNQELVKLMAQQQELQAEHEKCLRSLDALQGERSSWQSEMQSLTQNCSQLRREADQARTALAAETAGKAASVAQLAQEKEEKNGLRKALTEQQRSLAQVSSESTILTSKVKDLEERLRQVDEAKITERAHELRSRAAGEERETEELRRQLKQAVEEQVQSEEKAKTWQHHLQKAQSQIADLMRELEVARRPDAEERIAAATLELPEDFTSAEEKQRARPGARSVIVRSSVRSATLSHPLAAAAPVSTYQSMSVPQAPQAGRRTGKVTHIGTTTTMGNVSVFSPSAEGNPLPPGSPALPIGTAFAQVATLPRSSVPAAPVTSIHLPTAAGLVHGQIGIHVGSVRRIR